MADLMVQKHLAVQDLSKLKIEELTPLTPEVISRQVTTDQDLSLSLCCMDGQGSTLTPLD